MVSYWAVLKVAVYGKKVCGHDPSSKEGLKAGQGMTSEESAEVSTAIDSADISEAGRA